MYFYIRRLQDEGADDAEDDIDVNETITPKGLVTFELQYKKRLVILPDCK